MNELRQQSNIALIIRKVIELNFRIFVFNTKLSSIIISFFLSFLFFCDFNQRNYNAILLVYIYYIIIVIYYNILIILIIDCIANLYPESIYLNI